ncbi:winged helix-turn-helix domain-containing tetratricopeptide repeat protein [Roseobacter ponti]|uniref:OmpR/PhoB-type domain-containing protein n=1 Tax=Roseobacter ponti TaxID=1891787 RepID=A0A858SR24_9RHOB|nr:winged helix-turn-helix domain-containing protein [Roseobacter ponti]QJF51115.1 hypothetical protein G3256_08060 [Roseobacter ponti]
MTSEIAPKSGYLRVGQGHYDPASGALTGAGGSRIRLRKQSGEVLAALAEHAGEVVSREELTERVWKDIATTDDSLIQCIGDIRRALGKEVIETWPKVGYRLVVEPAAIPETKASKHRRMRNAVTLAFLAIVAGGLWLWSGPGHLNKDAALVVPPRILPDKTLAVLPFVNLGGGDELQYFGDGLSEDLTTDLAKVPDLTVIAYASSGDFPQAETGFRGIADDLGVRYLVRGTVRHSDNRVRINVSLIDPYEGVNIWAERFDRVRQDPFDVQEDVTRAIVEALSLSLDAGVAPSRVATDAYFLLLRGLEPLREHTVAGNARAREYFMKALELEPDYARAHASVAVAYGRDVMSGYGAASRQNAVQAGLRSAITAIQLDPDIPNAYFALAILNLAIREHDKALAAARHSIRLNRNFADGYAVLAEAALYGGDLHEALEAIEHAKRLHPHYPARFDWIEGHIHFQLGDPGSAKPLLETTVEKSPGFTAAYAMLAAVCTDLGEPDCAGSALAAVRVHQPDFSVEGFLNATPYKSKDRHRRLAEALQRANAD